MIHIPWSKVHAKHVAYIEVSYHLTFKINNVFKYRFAWIFDKVVWAEVSIFLIRQHGKPV